MDFMNADTTKENCMPLETPIQDVMLANAYVPFEKLCGTYSPMLSLKKGTAFPPLFNAYGWERRQREVQDDD